MFHFEGVFV